MFDIIVENVRDPILKAQVIAIMRDVVIATAPLHPVVHNVVTMVEAEVAMEATMLAMLVAKVAMAVTKQQQPQQ